MAHLSAKQWTIVGRPVWSRIHGSTETETAVKELSATRCESRSECPVATDRHQATIASLRIRQQMGTRRLASNALEPVDHKTSLEICCSVRKPLLWLAVNTTRVSNRQIGWRLGMLTSKWPMTSTQQNSSPKYPRRRALAS